MRLTSGRRARRGQATRTARRRVDVIGGLALCGIAAGLAACGGDSGTSPSNTIPTYDLAVGQSVTFLDSAHMVARLTVVPGARYLVTVVNTASTSDGFDLRGSFSSSSAQAAGALARRPAGTRVPTAAVVPSTRSVPRGGVVGAPAISAATLQHVLDVTARSERAHVRRLSLGRALATRLGSPFAGLAARREELRAAGPSARALGAPNETIGAVNTWYVSRDAGSCANVDTIGARTVAVASKAVILADTVSTWTQRPDSSFYQTLADEYSTLTYEEVVTNFGDPLLIDSTLSNVGKVTIVLTPRLNLLGGIAAFVNPCDFHAQAGSNVTESIYSWVADSVNGYPLDLWQRFVRPTLAHETKHVASFAQRFSDGGVFEDTWLEEGTAQISSEIWMRNFDLNTWKGGATFAQTFGCEFVTSEPCYADSKPAGLFNHLIFLYQFLDSASDTPNVEALGTTVPSEYGGGWSFARWSADQFAASEPAFFHALIDDRTNTGVANLAAHTGQPAGLLQLYWAMATAIDSVRVTPTDVRVTVPSFDYADIFAVGDTLDGGFFSTIFTHLAPTRPTEETTGTFDATIAVVPAPAGAGHVFINATTAGSQRLELRSATGGVPLATSGLRVGILRVQ